jgi:hypothetical protein
MQVRVLAAIAATGWNPAALKTEQQNDLERKNETTFAARQQILIKQVYAAVTE